MVIKFSLAPEPLFLVPDIKALVKFSNGDLGIADQSKKRTIADNLSSVTSEETFEQFKQTSEFNLTGANSSYLKNGKYNVPASDINLNGSDLMGLKALEKSLIQSIFESQKPYAEIFIQTTGVLVKVEDVIARVLSIGGSSLKPIYNPKALGYNPPGGKSELSQSLSKLNSLKNKKRGFGTQSSTKITSSPNYSPTGFEYKILSTVYSTGQYDPNVTYNYEYIDIKDDSINDAGLDNNSIDVSTNESSDAKPKVVVFGIFDSKGRPLGTIPNWLLNSGKWFGQFDIASDVKFTWTKSGHKDILSYGSPGKGWIVKKDINGSPLSTFGSSSSSIADINNYYKDSIQSNLDQLNINKQDQKNIIEQINTSLSSGTSSIYQMQLDALFNSGFLPTLQLNKGTNPLGKFPLLPKKIQWSGTSSVTKEVWIDPENDYDMKVIKISPTFKVKFVDKSNKLIEGEINPITVLQKLKKNEVEIIVPSHGKFGNIEVINSNQIKNSQLSINTPYSKGYYGSSSDDNKQDLESILRYATSPMDNETYYIIEGILESENEQSFPIMDGGVKVSGTRYYKFPKGPISAIGAFIRMIIDVFYKLFPSIALLEQILSNPAGFLVNEIILKRIGDNDGTESPKFDTFSSDFLKDFEKLQSISPELRKDFVENSKLKDYVYVADDYTYQFLLDGESIVSFLSINFGISLIDLMPSLITKSLEERGLSSSTPSSGINHPKTQPVLQFMLNLVTFPLNIIKGIIEYILNFFKSLSNPFSLPSDIIDFISFKWILEFFNPFKLLNILGINFDIPKFSSWISGIDSYPNDHLFDLSEIIAIPFVPKLFSVTKDQLLNLKNSPMDLLSAIICLLGDIINAFIDFIWALMGLRPILEPPHVKICQDTNKAIINSKMQPNTSTQSSSIESQLTSSNSNSSKQLDKYAYNITLPDGTYLTGLTYDQLLTYLNIHKDLQFNFNF